MAKNYTQTQDTTLLGRKTKGLVKHLGGLAANFYIPTEVMSEGTPVIRNATTNTSVDKAAITEGATVIGLAMQDVYSESAFGQLQGYHFANDTRQPLNGEPIGVLMGAGWALTTYYTGTVAAGDSVYITASGLAASGSANARIPAAFEEAGTDGATPVRIRFDFPLAARA
jgi:hypothetical protein